MPINTIIRLVHGNKTFNLNDQEVFYLTEAFTPPSTQESLNVGGPVGREGGSLKGVVAQDRQWQITLLVKGGSQAENNRAIEMLQEFLSYLHTNDENMYLEYCINASIPYKPTWGQAGWRRAKIKHAQVGVGSVTVVPVASAFVILGLLISPYIEGLEQSVLSLGGGVVIEDNLFSPVPRGTVVLKSIKNLITNPIFGNPVAASFASGWLHGAEIVKRLVTYELEPQFVLFGQTSAEIMRVAGTGDGSFANSVTAGNTNTWCLSVYIRRVDGGAIGNKVQAFYNSVASNFDAFIPLPNGWYRAYKALTAVAGSAYAGVALVDQKIPYIVTGFQFEEVSYPSPFVWGDMPHATWSTLASRPLTQSDTLSNGYVTSLVSNLLAGSKSFTTATIRVAWRWHYGSTYGNPQPIFHTATSNELKLYYDASDDKLKLTDGTNTIASSVLTFSAGDLMVAHITIGEGFMKLYINGALVATTAAHAISSGAPEGTVYFGTDVTYYSHALFLDFVVWRGVIADDTQITNDATNVLTHISGGPDSLGQRLGTLPILAARAGVGLHTYRDPANSKFDTVYVIGVPGNTAAIFKTSLFTELGKSVLLANHTSRFYINPDDLFKDASGTVVSGAVGGQVEEASVNTTAVKLPATGLTIKRFTSEFIGKEFYINAAIRDAGANLQAAVAVKMGGGYEVIGDYRTIGAAAGLKIFRVGPIIIPQENILLNNAEVSMEFYLYFKRTTAGAANVGVDFIRVIVGDVTYIRINNGSSQYITYSSEGWINAQNSSGVLNEKPVLYGDYLEVYPAVNNFIFARVGTEWGDQDITDIMSFYLSSIIPRWGVL